MRWRRGAGQTEAPRWLGTVPGGAGQEEEATAERSVRGREDAGTRGRVVLAACKTELEGTGTGGGRGRELLEISRLWKDRPSVYMRGNDGIFKKDGNCFYFFLNKILRQF